MMQTMSIKDTRDNLAEIIDRVAVSGEQFVVTKFGKPRAMLVPVMAVGDTQSINGYDEVFGAWKGRSDLDETGNWVRNIRKLMSVRQKDE